MSIFLEAGLQQFAKFGSKFVFAEGTPPVTLRAPGTLGKSSICSR